MSISVNHQIETEPSLFKEVKLPHVDVPIAAHFKWCIIYTLEVRKRILLGGPLSPSWNPGFCTDRWRSFSSHLSGLELGAAGMIPLNKGL